MLKALLPDEDAVKDSKSFALMRKYKNAYVRGSSHGTTIAALSEFIEEDRFRDLDTRTMRLGVVYAPKGMGKSSVLTEIVDAYSVRDGWDVMYHIHDGTPAQAARIFGVIGDKCFLKSGLSFDAIGSWVRLLADDVDVEAKERRVSARNVVMERLFKAAKHLSRGLGSYGHVFNKLGKQADQLMTVSGSASMQMGAVAGPSEHRSLLIVIDDFDALCFDGSDEPNVDVMRVLLACLMFRPFPTNVRVVIGFGAVDSLRKLVGSRADLADADHRGTEFALERGQFTDTVGIWANLSRSLGRTSAEFDRIVRKYQPRSVAMHLFSIPPLSAVDIVNLANRRANLAGGKTIDSKFVDVLKQSACCKNPFIASYVVDFLITRGTFETMQGLLDSMMGTISAPVDVVRHQITVMEAEYEYIENFHASVIGVLRAAVRRRAAPAQAALLQEVIEAMHLTDMAQIEHVESAWRSLCRETLLFHVQSGTPPERGTGPRPPRVATSITDAPIRPPTRRRRAHPLTPTDGRCAFREFARAALDV